ncbi:MAG: Zn-ribbon domain-containing OB-fold protein [Gammaproteobacteria bacterium]
MATSVPAARAGRLLLRRCRNCGRPHYCPRPTCPFCMSEDTEWLEASGPGEDYSRSVQRRADPSCAVAFIAHAEGPTIMTALVDCDLAATAVGQPVTPGFEQRDGRPLPVFSPAD